MNPLNPEDIQELQQLIDFLKENQVAEFEWDRGETRVLLKFEQPLSTQAGVSDLAGLLGNARAASAQPPAPNAAAPPPAETPQADPDAGLHLVKSPIVGTYYGSPSPGASPFVRSAARRARK